MLLEYFKSATGILLECFWITMEYSWTIFGLLSGVLSECFWSSLGLLWISTFGVLSECFWSTLEYFWSAFGLYSFYTLGLLFDYLHYLICVKLYLAHIRYKPLAILLW